MLERIYYTLPEAEEILQTSRDGLRRLTRAGFLVMHGEMHGKRVTGASLRALNTRIEQGEDIWQLVKDHESAARSAQKPTAKARSTKTNAASGGTNPQPKIDADSLASAPLQSKRPSWLKEII